MKKVIVIVGPTASGKTKYSLELAKALNGEIINGDSVQVYKELNIGSAKIKESEMNNIKHHLLDVTSVFNKYTVYDFQKDARSLIKDIKTPIIVGGTGLYIKAALYDYEFNKEDENTNEFEELTNEELYEKIKSIDQNLDIDKNNRRRLVRAYNLALSGNLRSLKTKKDIPLYDIMTIYLDIDRTILKDILKVRLDEMIDNGLIDETKELKDQGITLNTIGYREINSYLDNLITIKEAKEEIVKSSLRLAKRQKTWFLNQMDAISIDPLDELASEKILKIALEFMDK